MINLLIDFDYPKPIPGLEKTMGLEKKKNKSLLIIRYSNDKSLLAKIKNLTIKVPFTFISFITTFLLVVINIIIFNLSSSQTFEILFVLFSFLVAELIIFFFGGLYIYIDNKIQSLNFKKVMQRYFRQEKIDLNIENINILIQNFKKAQNKLNRKSGFFLYLSRLYYENFLPVFLSSLLLSGFYEAFLNLKFSNMFEINPFGTLFIFSIPLSLKYLGEVKNPVNLCDKAIQALEEIKNDIYT